MPRPRKEPELDPVTGEPIEPEPKPEKAPRQPHVYNTKLVPKKAIESSVGLLNGVIGMLSPADALTMGERAASPTLTLNLEDEFGMLVDALDSTQKDHLRFRTYLARFCLFSGGANLLGVIGLMLYRRYLIRQAGMAQQVPQEPQPGTQTPEPVHVRPNGISPFEPEKPAWSNADGVTT